MQNGRYILMRGASEPLAHFFAKMVGFKFRKNENDSSNKAWSENKTTPANFVFEASRTADANYAYASGHLLVCASRTPRGGRSPGGRPGPCRCVAPQSWPPSASVAVRASSSQSPWRQRHRQYFLASATSSSSFFQHCLPNPPQGRSLTLRAPPPLATPSVVAVTTYATARGLSRRP